MMMEPMAMWLWVEVLRWRWDRLFRPQQTTGLVDHFNARDINEANLFRGN